MRTSETSVDEIHEIICQSAAALASKRAEDDPRVQEAFPGLSGQIFHEATRRSHSGGLAIAFQEGLELGPPEGVARLRQIAADAIRESLIRNQDLFVGLIVGQARHGTDYFRRFGESGYNDWVDYLGPAY